MRSRLAVGLLVLALIPVVPTAGAVAASGPAAEPAATAAAKKRKKCKKGYVRKRVKVTKGKNKGKRVVRCVKRKKRGGSTTTPGATPTPDAGGGGSVVDPAATWRGLVAGASFTHSTFNASTGGSSKTVFNFCGDGASFTYYYEFVGSVYNEAKNRNGTYQLTRTETGSDAGGTWIDGLITYQSNIEERPSGEAVVRVYPSNPGLAYINSGDGAAEFSRTTPSGC